MIDNIIDIHASLCEFMHIFEACALPHVASYKHAAHYSHECATSGYEAHAFWIAACEGYTDIVQCLVERPGVDVNQARRDNGMTPLMIAAWQSHLEIVRFLIQSGRANIDHTAHDGSNALYDACHSKNVEICGRLLVAGITLQPQHFQHRLTFTTQVLDWAAERLACHHRFMTVVLFAMHENSGALVAMIGMVEEVKALVAEFLDIQTGADLRRLRGITPALQAIAVNADDDDEEPDGDGQAMQGMEGAADAQAEVQGGMEEEEDDI